MNNDPTKSAQPCGCDEGAGWTCEQHRAAVLTDTYVIKDSGKRAQLAGGMVRDVAEGKLRPDLIKDGPMYLRWVLHLTRGAVKYAARNWMLGKGQDAYDRALESADRHFLTWYMWRRYKINIEDPLNPTTLPLTEDHAAAVYFNINSVEYVTECMQQEGK